MAEQPQPQPQVLYLEPDDEIPTVIRRLGEAQGGAVVLVAPGRSKATSSAVGLRLIARRAADAGLEVSLVADPGSRLLAGEAGIPAFASVTEALSGNPPSEPEPVRPRAAIHVVRGERSAPLAALAAPASSGRPPSAPDGSVPRPAVSRAEDTQAVPVVTPQPAPRTAWIARLRRPRTGRGWAWFGASLVALVVLVAAVLPGATIRVAPVTRSVGPFTYQLPIDSQPDSFTLASTQSADATGTYDASTPATGSVTFANYSFSSVTVPKGTRVSAGDITFTTDQALVVSGRTATVGVTAQNTGTDGNVAADAIDTIDDQGVRNRLCPVVFACPRLVANREPLTGGDTKTGSEISQKDVDRLVAAVKADLERQLSSRLSGHPDRLYAPASAQDPVVNVPDNLVGTRDQATFQLTGTLSYASRYVAPGAVTTAADARVREDPRARPAGTMLVDGSIAVSQPRLSVSGEQVTAAVDVTASVAPLLDESQIKARVAGLSQADAEQALSDMGSVSVELWPGWVDAVPRLPFRIQVRVETPSPSPSVAPLASPST